MRAAREGRRSGEAGLRAGRPGGPAAALALALGAGLGLAAPAAASVTVALDIPELAARAEEVVVATVLGARAEPARGTVVTRVTVRVELAVAGIASPPDELEVVVPGGELGRLGMLVQGAPRLEVGGRYLVFLVHRSGELRVVGMAQGALPVRLDRSGELQVGPAERLPGLVRAVGGRLLPADPAPRSPEPLEVVVERIRQARRAAP